MKECNNIVCAIQAFISIYIYAADLYDYDKRKSQIYISA